jgi:hypothetical protein
MLNRWITVPRTATRTSVVARKSALSAQTHARYCLSAQVAIFVVAFLWSRIVDEGFFSGDALTYFKMLGDGTWLDWYKLQPVLFLLLGLFHPQSFASFVFFSAAIPLTVLLYAFYRLNYSPLDQFLLIIFFSCSFYGIHFLLDFQRQFYAVAFFVLALSLKTTSLIARLASLFSHAYAFALHAFWAARRLGAIPAIIACLPVVPLAYWLAKLLIPEETSLFTGIGETSAVNVIVKQLLNLIYALIVLLTLRPGANDLRSATLIYTGLSVPTFFWMPYRGAFARFDYYFFPALIALWPAHVNPRRRWMFRIVLICSTVLGFYLWVHMNFAWIINGAE